MKNPKVKTYYYLFVALLFLLISSCTTEKEKFEWKTISPKELNINEDILNDLVQKINDSTIHSVDGIVLVKDEKIVFEEYFNGFTKDSLHNTASVGKSVTSALVGIAIENGQIPSLETTVMDFFTDSYAIEHLNEEKRNINIEHFLTMSSGLDCDDWDDNSLGNTKHFIDAKDDFALTLNLTMTNKNRERFAYCSGGANLLGEIIRKQSSQSLKEFADKELFNKIGIYENEWFIVPKEPYSEFAGGGNILRPRDMARFGLLYLNQGNWNGKQVIPSEWIEKSTSKQIEVPSEPADYGYFWWIKSYQYQGQEMDAFEASGNGGNKITVIPELNLVFVLTGSGYGSEYVEGEQAKKIIENYILKSIN
jgi:CubicO group peptidase (beta-lactamase class C family)